MRTNRIEDLQYYVNQLEWYIERVEFTKGCIQRIIDREREDNA